VTQFCIEEACLIRADHAARKMEGARWQEQVGEFVSEGPAAPSGPANVWESSDPAVSEARQWAAQKAQEAMSR
jgi:hypothetical protein